ncbi:hypothetical protein K4E66_001825 [Escherichia coli]|nr:hypothetical protein [Escherichia coli]
MINYETGMLEWIDGGEVKTRDDAYGNPKDIFIHATSPNETLKTAVTAEWFERNKVELGYW